MKPVLGESLFALTNPMKIISLNCCQCSAPLNASEDVRHVMCQHCGSRLVVLHEGAAAYTERCEPKPMEAAIEQLLEESEQQRTLAELDREWQQERRRYLLTSSDGRTYLPTVRKAHNNAILTIVLGLIFAAAVWLVVEGLAGFLFATMLAGLFVVAGCAMSHFQSEKGAAYQEAERCYRRRRLDLIEKPEAYPTKGWG